MQGDGRTGPGRGAVLGALSAGALAQALKFRQVLPAASLLLDLVAALALRRVFARRPSPTAVAASPPQPCGGSLAWWSLGSAAVLAAVTCSWLLYLDFARYLGTVLWVGPLALCAVALVEDRLAGYSFPPKATWRTPLRHHLPLLLVLFVGALYRFGPTGYFPPPDGFSSIEEMQRASGGMLILRGSRPWEFPLAQYLAAASFAVFGSSIYSLRLPVTILAWLTLPVFYLLAREMVSRPAAVFATALLAVSRWHLQVGWYSEDVYLPLFPFVVLLYLLVRTRRDPRPSWYVAAGALCGYLLYDYAAYRGAIGLALAFIAADAIWQRRSPADLRRVALLVAVFVLFLPPLTAVLRRGGANFYTEALARSFADRNYYTSDPADFVRQRLKRIRHAADVFTVTDHARFFATLNVPHAPLLDPVSGVVFSLGFGTTLLLPRRRYYAFFGAAFLLLAGGAMVVTWNLDFRRLAILIPFVFLFAAFLADELLHSPLAGRAITRGLAAAAIAAAVANAWFVLFVLAPSHPVRAAHRTPYTVPLSYLRSGYRGEFVVLLSREPTNFFESNDYDWLKPSGLNGQLAPGVEALLPIDPPPPLDRDVLVLVARPYDIATVLEQIEDAYPQARCVLRTDPDHERHDLGVCRLPAATAPSGLVD